MPKVYVHTLMPRCFCRHTDSVRIIGMNHAEMCPNKKVSLQKWTLPFCQSKSTGNMSQPISDSIQGEVWRNTFFHLICQVWGWNFGSSGQVYYGRVWRKGARRWGLECGYDAHYVSNHPRLSNHLKWGLGVVTKHAVFLVSAIIKWLKCVTGERHIMYSNTCMRVC